MNTCFTLVEPGYNVTKVSNTGDLPEEVLQKVLKKTRADYVLIGKADIIDRGKIKIGGSASSFTSYHLALNARLFSTDTGEIVATTTAQGTIPALNTARALAEKSPGKKYTHFEKRILNKFMDSLFENIAKKWSDEALNGARVLVEVNNVKKYGDATAFAKALKKTFPKGTFSPVKKSGKTATLDASVEGGAQNLAAKMEGKKVGRYTIEVADVTPGRVTLELK